MSRDLLTIYQKLYRRFGPQHWWPADSPFEVMVGAILTQNTSWQNVEKAIKNLKKNNLMTEKSLAGVSTRRLAGLIRPAGYFNIKAKRLRNFLDFFCKNYKTSIRRMRASDTGRLREELLSVNGIGKETADSILLYALQRPVFVVDAYTKRIFSRHGFICPDATYDEAQGLFTKRLKKDVGLFNEYHALLVRLGKEYCLKNKARCQECPLK